MTRLDAACSPEKLYLLACELLRDDGCETPQLNDVAALLGAALAYSYIDMVPDLRDTRAFESALADVAAYATDFHSRFVELLEGKKS